jgi:hypothetical protein
MISVAALAVLAACSNGAAPNAANNATPANTAAAPAGPSTPGTGTVSGTFTVDGKPATLAFVGAYKQDPIDGKPVIAIVMSTLTQAGSTDAAAEAITTKFGTEVIVLDINPDGTFVEASVYNKDLKAHVITMEGGITIKNFTSAGGTLSGEVTNNGPADAFGQKVNIDETFKVTAPT